MTTNKDLWNRRAAFVSGSLLGWGVILISLHTILSRMQAPSLYALRNLSNLPTIHTNQLLDPRAVHFLALSILVAIGIVVAVLAILHLLLYGLSLRVASGTNSSNVPFDMLGNATYEGFFAFLLFAAFTVVPTLPVLYGVVYLQRWLVVAWGATTTVSAWTVTILIFFLSVTPVLFFRSRLITWLTTWLSEVDAFIETHWKRAISYLCLMGLYSLVYATTIATAYTMSLSAEKNFVQRSKDSYVEIRLDLGGSTSDPELLRVDLLQPNAGNRVLVRTLQPVEITDGKYMLYLPLSDLTDGRYIVRLMYDRKGLMLPLLFGRTIEASLAFVIAK